MTSDYQIIYSRFLPRITDYKILGLDVDIVNEMMNGWMHSVISEPYIRRLFSSAVFDDEVMKFNFELKTAIDDETDFDFVLEVLARGMVIKWLEPQVNSVINLSQMFAGKEQKFYAQANHLSTIKSLLDSEKTELRKMIRDRGYIHNSYISE